MAKFIAILVLALSIFAISCGGAKSGEVPVSTATVQPEPAGFPERLQEIVDQADKKIAESGADSWQIFYNDQVSVVYNPTYQDYLEGPIYPAFIIRYHNREQAEGIVTDFFRGLDTDPTSLKMVWVPWVF